MAILAGLRIRISFPGVRESANSTALVGAACYSSYQLEVVSSRSCATADMQQKTALQFFAADRLPNDALGVYIAKDTQKRLLLLTSPAKWIRSLAFPQGWTQVKHASYQHRYCIIYSRRCAHIGNSSILGPEDAQLTVWCACYRTRICFALGMAQNFLNGHTVEKNYCDCIQSYPELRGHQSVCSGLRIARTFPS